MARCELLAGAMRLSFDLDPGDVRLAEEIGLAGVVAGKIARGAAYMEEGLLEVERRPGIAPREIIDTVYAVTLNGQDVFTTKNRALADVYVAGRAGRAPEKPPTAVLTAAEALNRFKAVVRSVLPFASVGTLLATVERVAFEAEDDGA